ncbi:hypothetical protein NE237_029420 [Protea cynaroides]|uniref:ELMO domain-containing protein n=1 Tax=Protea cynaroides TaxID=273540 RepID=A0A9Q0GRR7_9MAGN|nr:hypothetical protein NE237_029420 [Protea cynaroides]
MEDRGESFVAVRRISPGLERGSSCHSSSAEVVAGSAAWLGRGLSCVCVQGRESDAHPSFDLTPIQEECLQRLQSRIGVAYDSSRPEHEEALRALWHAAFPEEELHGLISEQWKEMGWQGKDPSTDFRGGGFISLENLLFFARNYPKSFHSLLRKQEGDRSMWEYPFAVAGVNITFMLIQMLDLQSVKPRTEVGAIFLKLFSENESAFDILYCIAFKLVDQQWLAMRASYMDFNIVMKSTRRLLERELLHEDTALRSKSFFAAGSVAIKLLLSQQRKPWRHHLLSLFLKPLLVVLPMPTLVPPSLNVPPSMASDSVLSRAEASNPSLCALLVPASAWAHPLVDPP